MAVRAFCRIHLRRGYESQPYARLSIDIGISAEAVRLVGAGPIGLESVFVYVPGIFETPDPDPLSDIPPSNAITKSHSYALMGNVVLTTPRAWNQYGLRPYVSGGLGMLRVSHNEPTLPGPRQSSAYNVGGGAVGLLTNRGGLTIRSCVFSEPCHPARSPGRSRNGRPSTRARALLDWDCGRGVQVRKGDSPFLRGCGLSQKGTVPFSLGRDLQAGFPIAGGIDAAVQDGSLDDDHRRS